MFWCFGKVKTYSEHVPLPQCLQSPAPGAALRGGDITTLARQLVTAHWAGSGVHCSQQEPAVRVTIVRHRGLSAAVNPRQTLPGR